MLNLIENQITHVAHMQYVANLLSVTAESDIAQRLLIEMRGDPERYDTLIGFPHLSWPGNEPETVDDETEPIGIGILFDQIFRCELSRPIWSPGAIERERLLDGRIRLRPTES